jgi:NADH dehydrogenase FAD-containing subunit
LGVALLNPRDIIRNAAEEDIYEYTEHALEEKDIHGLSTTDIESVMIRGVINQRDPENNRYRLRHRDIQIVVEIPFRQVIIVTVMKD